jgi:hypothetical protein
MSTLNCYHVTCHAKTWTLAEKKKLKPVDMTFLRSTKGKTREGKLEMELSGKKLESKIC